jgi:hypothetical protein
MESKTMGLSCQCERSTAANEDAFLLDVVADVLPVIRLLAADYANGHAPGTDRHGAAIELLNTLHVLACSLRHTGRDVVAIERDDRNEATQ